MTGAEMFDAIAYIDEDLIDRCLAVKAVNAVGKAIDGAAPSPERRRRWLPYAALAAVLVLAFAIAAALRLGQKSPKPDEFPGTDTGTEAPEATSEPTPEPTEEAKEYVESPELAAMALDSLEYGKDYIALYEQFGQGLGLGEVMEDENGLAYIERDGKKYELGLDFLSKAMVYNAFPSGGYATPDEAYAGWWRYYVTRYNYLLPHLPLYRFEQYTAYNALIKGTEDTPVTVYRTQAEALIYWTSEKEDGSITLSAPSYYMDVLRQPGFNLNHDHLSTVNELCSLANGLALASRDGHGNVIWDPTVVEEHAISANADGACTLRIKVRSGLRLSDGSPVTARSYLAMPVVCMTPVYEAAVETQTERHSANPNRTPGGPDFIPADEPFRAYEGGEGGEGGGVLRSIRLVDDMTIEFTLPAEIAENYTLPAWFIDFTAQPADAWLCGAELKDDGEGVYLTPDFYERDGEGFKHAGELLGLCSDHSTEALGKHAWSGAYIPTEAQLDENGRIMGMTFKKNPYYNGNFEGVKPSIETVVYADTDVSNQFVDIAEGRLDVLTGWAESAVRNILEAVEASDGALTCTHCSRPVNTGYFFRADLGAAQFASVRRALAYCLEREEYMQDFTGGYGSVPDGPFCSDFCAYELASGRGLNFTDYGTSLEKAIAQLEADGWVWGENGESYTEGVRYKRIPAELVSGRDRGFASLDGSVKGYEKDGYFYMPLVINLLTSLSSEYPDLDWVGEERANVFKAGFHAEFFYVQFTALLDELHERNTYGLYNGAPKYNLFKLTDSCTGSVFDRHDWHTIDPELYDSRDYSSTLYLKDYADIYMMEP